MDSTEGAAQLHSVVRTAVGVAVVVLLVVGCVMSIVIFVLCRRQRSPKNDSIEGGPSVNKDTIYYSKLKSNSAVDL